MQPPQRLKALKKL